MHQTDFPSIIPRSQKTQISEGFCEDNLPLQMAEQNSQGEAGPAILSIPTCAPPRQAYGSCLLTNSNADCDSCTCPTAVKKSSHHFLHKSPHFCIRSKSGGCSFVIGIIVKGLVVQLVKIKKFRHCHIECQGDLVECFRSRVLGQASDDIVRC